MLMREPLMTDMIVEPIRQCGGGQLSEPIINMLHILSSLCRVEYVRQGKGCVREERERRGSCSQNNSALLAAEQSRQRRCGTHHPALHPPASASPGPSPVKQERSGRSSAFLQPSVNTLQPCLSVGTG